MRTKGDIYRIKFGDQTVGYMQHLTNDTTQLSSNVVLVLQQQFNKEDVFRADMLLKGNYFFAHVILKAGEILGVWEKAMHCAPVLTDPLSVVWATYSHVHEPAEIQIKTTMKQKWFIWRTNEERREPLTQDHGKECELGSVLPPPVIAYRAEHKCYPDNYRKKIEIELRLGVIKLRV